MKVSPVCLEAGDAVELAEMLEFLGRWLTCDGEGVAASFGRFVGSAEYGIGQLRADVSRFAFLLGADGAPMFGEDER